MPLKGAPSARVAVPQGAIYPSGLPVIPADPNIQATVRPEQWLFHQSAGFHTIRPGSKRFQDGYRGPGIAFSPLRFAEDIAAYDNAKGLPRIVSQEDAFMHADIADIPGSQFLDSSGRISSADDVQANQGILVGSGTAGFAHHDGRGDVHAHLATVPDMGDREPNRPLTRAFLRDLFTNPLGAFKDEYRTHPVTAIVVAAGGISLAYMIGRDLEYQFESRRGRGATGAAAAAAPAAVATGGREVERAGSASGNIIEDAGGAVKDVTQDVGNVVKDAADAVTPGGGS